MNLLLTGSRAAITPLLARTLHNAGCTVYTADSLRPTLGRFSRYSAQDLPLPPANQDRAQYGAALARYISRFQIQWIIPCGEEAFHLAHSDCSRRVEAAGARLFLTSSGTLTRLYSKHDFARLAALLGLDVPETRRLTTPQDWGRLDYFRDAFLKREYSRAGEGIVPLVGSYTERQRTAMAALERDGIAEWVWQQRIYGRAISSYSVCLKGEVRCHIAYTSPYRTSAYGPAAYVEATPAPELFNAARRLAEATEYTGHLGLDAVQDSETGTFYLIECSPLATMGMLLLADREDFAAAWRELLSGEPFRSVVPAEIPALRAQARMPTLLYGWKYRAPQRSLARWLSDCLGTPDALASREGRFHWVQPVVLACHAYQAQEAGRTLPGYLAQDTEWKGPEAEAGRNREAERIEPVPLFAPPMPQAMEPLLANLEPRLLPEEPLLRRPALFCAYPELEEHLPWSPLLTPRAAPVQKVVLPGLETEIWLKRDDQNDSRFGGATARKFEWILGELLSRETRELVSFGGLSDPYCLASAIYGEAAGLQVRLYLVPSALTAEERDLLYLQTYLGAAQKMLDLPSLLELGSEFIGFEGPYLVPPSGSSSAGVLGFVDAGLELAEQIRQNQLPLPDLIYLPAATLGTAFGLKLGLYLSGLSPLPRLVAVESVQPLWQQVRRALLPGYYRTRNRLGRLLPAARPLLPSFSTLISDIQPDLGQLAPGNMGQAIDFALDTAAQLGGLPLDRHYSARAFAALLADARNGGLKGRNVLFWQTTGVPPQSRLAEARRLAAEGALVLPAEVARAAR